MWHQTRLRSSIFHHVEGFPWCLPVAVASLAPVGAGPVACVQLYSTVHVYSVTSGAQCSPASHMVRISRHPLPPTPSPRQWKYNSKWTIYLLLILVNYYKEICRYFFFENLTIKRFLIFTIISIQTQNFCSDWSVSSCFENFPGNIFYR